MTRVLAVLAALAACMGAVIGSVFALNLLIERAEALGCSETASTPELIRAGADYVAEVAPLNHLYGSPEELAAFREGFVAFNGTDDFLARNPECCQLVDAGPDGYRLGPLHRFTSGFEAFVRLDYVVLAKTQTSSELRKTITVFIPVTSCGEIVNVGR